MGEVFDLIGDALAKQSVPTLTAPVSLAVFTWAYGTAVCALATLVAPWALAPRDEWWWVVVGTNLVYVTR